MLLINRSGSLSVRIACCYIFQYRPTFRSLVRYTFSPTPFAQRHTPSSGERLSFFRRSNTELRFNNWGIQQNPVFWLVLAGRTGGTLGISFNYRLFQTVSESVFISVHMALPPQFHSPFHRAFFTMAFVCSDQFQLYGWLRCLPGWLSAFQCWH